MKEWTKEEIAANMERSDLWLMRGLLAIYARQTNQEKDAGAAYERNKAGFTLYDAPICMSIAEQVQAGNTLTEKQLAVIRNRMKKYAGQLAKIANHKI